MEPPSKRAIAVVEHVEHIRNATEEAKARPGNKKGDAVKSGSNQSSLVSGPEKDDDDSKREQTVTFNLNEHNHVDNDGSMHHDDNGSSHQGCVLAEPSSTSTLKKRNDVEGLGSHRTRQEVRKEDRVRVLYHRSK